MQSCSRCPSRPPRIAHRFRLCFQIFLYIIYNLAVLGNSFGSFQVSRHCRRVLCWYNAFNTADVTAASRARARPSSLPDVCGRQCVRCSGVLRSLAFGQSVYSDSSLFHLHHCGTLNECTNRFLFSSCMRLY